jgi:YbbR domain-containing protein
MPTERTIEKERRQVFFRRVFRRVFLEDWSTKLIALGISLALWFGVTGLRDSTSRRLKLTLNMRNSNDMEITNTSAQDVEVVVSGDKQKVDKLNERDLVMVVDLTDIKSGDRAVLLTPENVNLELPNGVKLDKIQPDKIAVRLEKVEEREVDVKPDLEGNLAEGFEIYNMYISPAKVRVRGAESVVKSLDTISTEKISLENQKDNFTTRQVGLNVVTPKVTLLDTIVDISFIVGEKRTERMFLVPVKMERETKNATVVLYGARSLMEKLRAEDLHIELTKSENGGVVPQLIFPSDLQNKVEIRKIKLPS